MAVKNQLSGGAFQDAVGNVLANGYLILQLSQDAQVNGNTQVVGGYEITINLDASGNVVTSPAQSVWPNDVLSPAGTFYNVSGYTASGQLVWGPNAQQITASPSPFDVGAWIPGAVNVTSGGGGGGGGTVTSFSFTNANGVSGSVTNPTTTPNLTLALGNITPSSVAINGSQAFNGAQGIGTKVLSFTGSTGNSQVLGTDTNGTAIITGIGTGNLVTSIGNNVFVGTNQFTQNCLFDTVTAATNVTNQPAPLFIMSGNYWDGGSSQQDVWHMAASLGTGTNPISQLVFSHTGTIGFSSVKFTTPAFVNNDQILAAVGTPTSSATASNLSIPVTIGGTTYYVRLSSTP